MNLESKLMTLRIRKNEIRLNDMKLKGVKKYQLNNTAFDGIVSVAIEIDCLLEEPLDLLSDDISGDSLGTKGNGGTMTWLWIFGLMAYAFLLLCGALVEPTRRFLVEHRWAVDKEMK